MEKTIMTLTIDKDRNGYSCGGSDSVDKIKDKLALREIIEYLDDFIELVREQYDSIKE